MFQKTFILRRFGIAIFVDIIKIVTKFIKAIFKYSRKVRRIMLCIKLQSVYVLLDITKFVDFQWKKWCQPTSRYLSHDWYSFLDLLLVRYNCKASSLWDMCDRFWGGWGCFFASSFIHEQPRKSPSWIGLIAVLGFIMFCCKTFIVFQCGKIYTI